MNPIKSFLCCGLLLLFVTSAKAQDDRVRIGFGVGFGQIVTSLTSLPIDLADFSLIIRGKNFRFEPTLGYFSITTEEVSTETIQGQEVQITEESKSSNLRLGTVLAYSNTIGSTNLYYGIDFGVILSSQTEEATLEGLTVSIDESKTDFFIGPTVGGEYMFSDNFSLGGEIQINYISIGNFEDGEPLVDVPDVSTSAISSRGKVTLRWYVN